MYIYICKFFNLDYDPSSVWIQELKTLIEQPSAKTHIISLVPICRHAGYFYDIRKIHTLFGIVTQFLTLQGNQLHTYNINDIITLAKDFKMFRAVRQIISCIGTLTENISGVIDSVLQFIPSYVKDTTIFINKLTSVLTIPPEVLLVTSPYANIPHVDGLDACSKFLNHTMFPIFLPTFYVPLCLLYHRIPTLYLIIIAICQLAERQWVRRWRHVSLTL